MTCQHDLGHTLQQDVVGADVDQGIGPGVSNGEHVSSRIES